MSDRTIVKYFTGEPSKLVQINFFFRSLKNYLKWNWRFLSFGWGSWLEGFDVLTRPEQISLAKNVEIRGGARLEAYGDWDGITPKISIGENTSIQYYFHCGAAKSVKIGNNVLIAGRVYISDHDHLFDDPERPARICPELICAPVVIEDGVWIGEGCVILKGITIGQRAVIGANSVVTKNIPSFTVVAGVPAKIIRKIGN